MGKETWKQTIIFPGYEISSFGRIRNAGGEIMKPSSNGNGYLKFRRRVNGMFRSEYVHRLVARAFIPNPYGKPCVNHIDCNPSNNSADNLEWCTQAENIAHMKKLGRNKRSNEWIEHLYDGFENAGIFRPVLGRNLSTGDCVIFFYLNQVKAAGFSPSCVCNCCKNKRKQHKGYSWHYV